MRQGQVIIVGLLFVALAGRPSRAAAAQDAAAEAPLVATPSLHDVAMTRVVDGHPVIYYNPALMTEIGPMLSRFFVMHERGHIAGGHSGSALADPTFTGNALRLHQELEADCYATQRLAAHDRAAVEAALDFFLRMGKRSFDALHPTGSQRAAKILACLPD
jgi:hypothetical protein